MQRTTSRHSEGRVLGKQAAPLPCCTSSAPGCGVGRREATRRCDPGGRSLSAEPSRWPSLPMRALDPPRSGGLQSPLAAGPAGRIAHALSRLLLSPAPLREAPPLSPPPNSSEASQEPVQRPRPPRGAGLECLLIALPGGPGPTGRKPRPAERNLAPPSLEYAFLPGSPALPQIAPPLTLTYTANVPPHSHSSAPRSPAPHG